MNWESIRRTRRQVLRSGLLGGAALLGWRSIAAAQRETHRTMEMPPTPSPKGESSDERAVHDAPVRVVTPDVPRLPWKMDNGVKVFRLNPEVVKREVLPGWTFDLWGYNGSVPGPAIEVNEGDRVRFIVENRLPEDTTIHWHGLEVPIEMDGVPVISQKPIKPGSRFVYEFTLHQNGTFFYHSHGAMQEMIGMIGLFIIHPKKAYTPRVHKDFGLIVQEFSVLPNNTVPNSMSMEFNWLTINGKAGPATTPLLVRLGERVRLRIVNLGMDHHPIHLHGNTWWVTGTEGGRIPQSAWIPGNTVLVGVAEARELEFEAKYEGDWMLHCHLPHHMMNHMSSMIGPTTERRGGMPAGQGMEEGMGIIRRGPATAAENGPSIGRAMGVGSTAESATSNYLRAHRGHSGSAKLVPGFPQDMFMPRDKEVAKPATYGLPKDWSGAVEGMMTLVRVLKPELYDKIVALEKRGARTTARGVSERSTHRHE